MNTNLRPNGHTRAYSPGKHNPAENHKAIGSPTEVLCPNLQPRTKQHPTDLRKANLFTFTLTNKPQATDQPKHWALLSPCQNNRVATQAKILSIGGLKSKNQKRNGFRGRQSGPPVQQFNSSTGEALHGETGFARVFEPQNEGHKFRRKRNSFLDTSIAKPTPKHLLRMVEREVHLERLGASVERPV